MPEVLLDVRWPDGSAESFRSPTRGLEDHFAVGEGYPLAVFVARSRACMHDADARMRSRFGHGCARSMAIMARIETMAGRFAPTDEVLVESIRH